MIATEYAARAEAARAATIAPDAVWPLAPGAMACWASPDGRWRAFVRYAVWTLRDMDNGGAERGFYTLGELHAYVRRQYA
jgi:hypothetical protein